MNYFQFLLPNHEFFIKLGSIAISIDLVSFSKKYRVGIYLFWYIILIHHAEKMDYMNQTYNITGQQYLKITGKVYLSRNINLIST